MSIAAVRARVLAAVESVVAGSGADLEELTVASAGRRRLVRLVVDRDGGVPLDDVAELSRAVGEALDASDVMGGAPYVLEVTSPGVDRPLTEPRHWRRNVGRLVRAVLRDGGEHTGRVVRADDDGVVIEVAGTERTLPLRSVARGEVQVEFNRRGEAGRDGQTRDDEHGDEDGELGDEHDDEDGELGDEHGHDQHDDPPRQEV